MARNKRSLSNPLPVLDCARLLHYVRVDKSVGYVGRTLLFVGNKELGRSPCLAICEDSKAGVLLFHCNRNWKVLGCSGHGSVAAAKKKAEWIYPGLSRRWITANVTKKQARRSLDELWRDKRCDFCGKRPDQTEQIIAKVGVGICDGCIEEFHKMLRGGKREKVR
jgi:hypothetical protein